MSPAARHARRRARMQRGLILARRLDRWLDRRGWALGAAAALLLAQLVVLRPENF